MHVGCDAAECHRHILGYLKIDLAAFVCVRACVRARRSVASGPRCLFIIVLFIFHALIFYFFLLRRFCLSLACGAAVQGIEPIHRYMCSASLSLLLTHVRTHAWADGRTDRRTHVHAMVVMQVDIFLKCKKKIKKDWGDDMFPLTMLDNQRLLNCIPPAPQPLSPPNPSCWRPIVRLGGTVEDAGDSSQSCGLCILLWSVHS